MGVTTPTGLTIVTVSPSFRKRFFASSAPMMIPGLPAPVFPRILFSEPSFKYFLISVTSISRSGTIPRTTAPSTRFLNENIAWPYTNGLAATTPSCLRAFSRTSSHLRINLAPDLVMTI